MYLMRYIVQVILQNQKEILQKYSGTNYMWIEDRIDYAKDGQEVGLKTYLMDFIQS